MNKIQLLAAIALASTVAACDRPDSSRASANQANPPVPPATASTTPATRDNDTAALPPSQRPVEPTPATHAGNPQPEAPPAPTARDTTANAPQAPLTKSEETSAMPKAGQANNYNSPAYDPKQDAKR